MRQLQIRAPLVVHIPHRIHIHHRRQTRAAHRVTVVGRLVVGTDMLFADDTAFCGVLNVSLAGHYSYTQKLPMRATIQEAKYDLACFYNRCRCADPKHTGTNECLRSKFTLKWDFNIPPTWKVETMDYIENSRGFRAIPSKV